jgi:hypothetical protein
VIKYTENKNQVINEMNEVTLQTTPDMIYKNYLAVSTIKIDTKIDPTKGRAESDEKGFYKGALYLY